MSCWAGVYRRIAAPGQLHSNSQQVIQGPVPGHRAGATLLGGVGARQRQQRRQHRCGVLRLCDGSRHLRSTHSSGASAAADQPQCWCTRERHTCSSVGLLRMRKCATYAKPKNCIYTCNAESSCAARGMAARTESSVAAAAAAQTSGCRRRQCLRNCSEQSINSPPPYPNVCAVVTASERVAVQKLHCAALIALLRSEACPGTADPEAHSWDSKA